MKITKKEKKDIDKVIKKMWTPKAINEVNNVNFNVYLKDKLKDPEFKKEYDKVKLAGYCSKCGCELENGECDNCKKKVKTK